jgi:SOS-response transcriptional repressor LexA
MKPMNSATPVISSVDMTRAEKRVSRVPTEPLTRCEYDVLVGLERAIRKYGNPTLREIAQAAGPQYYASTAHRYLRKLELKGFVQMATRAYRQRSIRLLHAAPKKRGMR